MIESQEKHSFEDVQKIQLDVLVPEARILLPLMLKNLDTAGDPTLTAVKQFMAQWDLKATVDAPAMSIFALWKRALKDIVFQNEIELLEDMPLSRSKYRPPLDGLYRALRGEIVLTASLQEALVKSLRSSLSKLEDDIGTAGVIYENWNWGKNHKMTIRSTSGDSRWDLGLPSRARRELSPRQLRAARTLRGGLSGQYALYR